ncbi:UDP-glucose 4-epimerase GalE [Clostridiales bacterium COT073_COT-073]|nr:UDP-glucose 4-epimerase GalE [Clostridiales bacterium COT073_COT-073]
MAILVTGGAGYIGTHTCIELIRAGYEVIVYDNFSNSSPEAVRRTEEIVGQKITLIEGDILDKARMQKVFAENKIDSVIHFAGLKAVGESVGIPVKYYHNNITGTLLLLEVMQEYGVKKIVFSSSATVYGMNNPVPFVEDMPTSATNPYGWTKQMIEQILKDVYVSDPEWSIVLLRYFNPLGAHESGTIGENPNGIPNNLMPYITQVAVGKREILTVFGDDYDTPDGTGVRDYIHVMDLADGHVQAVKYAERHTGVEAVNLGTGKGFSVLEVIHTFETVNGVKVNYRIAERRPGDIASCYADVEKAKRLFNWETKKTLEDMCRDSWNWQSKNPEGY